MPRRIAVIAIAGLLLTAAVVTVSRLSAYYPGLSPAPGYRLWNATQPRGLFAGYAKTVRQFLDIRDCQYEILGWTADGVLYYRATCAGLIQAWHARPDEAGSVVPVTAPPHDLFSEPFSKTAVLDRVRAAGVLPPSAEPPTRGGYVRSQPYPSPDGRWLAFVAERVYGPQDVLLLTEAP